MKRRFEDIFHGTRQFGGQGRRILESLPELSIHEFFQRAVPEPIASNRFATESVNVIRLVEIFAQSDIRVFVERLERVKLYVENVGEAVIQLGS
ncbi:MAG: hypothetical protein SR1Q7_07535 [Quinella sp. 1Q7]|nr:hypothetical protein [Quinella sp. 1Q7]